MSADGPILQFDGLVVRYGKREALHALTAEVPPGAVGLLGPNGAGKSTLIKALLGLIPIHAGEARLLGLSVRKQAKQLRRRIGYMPEKDAAFPHLTGFQATWYAGRLAGMPDADARRRAHEVLLFAGLEEARYREVSTYSTGMQQRVRLAQALVHDPDLLFLDEPTNGLDPKGREDMLGLIETLSQDKGIHVVLSSHLLADVERVCQSVLVMRQGAIVRHGAIADLAAVLENLYEVELAGSTAAFTEAAQARGLTVERGKGTALSVRFAGSPDPREVFAAAQDSGTLVAALRPSRLSLEEALIGDLDGGVR